MGCLRNYVLVLGRYSVSGEIATLERLDPAEARIKKIAPRVAGGKLKTKFKIRCSRYLYTLSLDDPEKAEKLRQSLPPGPSYSDVHAVLSCAATDPPPCCSTPGTGRREGSTKEEVSRHTTLLVHDAHGWLLGRWRPLPPYLLHAPHETRADMLVALCYT